MEINRIFVHFIQDYYYKKKKAKQKSTVAMTCLSTGLLDKKVQ